MDPFDLRQWEKYNGPPLVIDSVAIHTEHVTGSHCLFVALDGTREDGHKYIQEAARRGARCALVQTAFDQPTELTLIRVPDPLQALQELATVYRHTQQAHIIAITGSFGKTMTKDLLFTLLGSKRCCASRESFNSQLGVALSLLEICSTDEIALIEAGISHPGDMDRLSAMIKPDSAILTCIGDAHLKTLKSREVLIREKGKLLSSVACHQWVLAPENLWNLPHWLPSGNKHPRLPTVTADASHPLTYHLSFPTDEHHTITLGASFPYLDKVMNPAIRAAWLLDVAPSEMCQALEGHILEPMRTEVWTSARGVTFINDCYGTDPLSINRALRMLPPQSNPLFLTSGTVPKPALHRLATRGPVLHIGTVQGTNITTFESQKSALQHLRTEQHQGQTVLIKGERRQPLNALRNDLADGLGDTLLEVHMDAIRHNLTVIAQRYNVTVIPMIKADGYGAGAVTLGRLLERCELPLLGVAHVSEAVRLRLAGIETGLFVFAFGPHEVPQVVQWGLEVGVDKLETIYALNQEASLRARKIRVHLHINTGMTRFGCKPEETQALELAIQQSPNLKLQGVFSHLGCANDPKKDRLTLKQLRLFSQACSLLNEQPPMRHLTNSAGTLRFGLAGCNTVRVGLALFGLVDDPHLKPALSLTTRLVGIHTCKRGDWVSYGAAYRVKKEGARIGVIPMGYFDGLRRTLSPGTHVLIHGKPVPIIGDICMDYAMVDLSSVPEAVVSDPVLIFGKDNGGATNPAPSVAAQGGLSTYELITGLGPRVQRLYIYEGESRDLL